MIKTKVYLYDSSQENNGYRGEDLSKYVLQGNQFTEDVTQEMDTAEITLCGLNTQKEFAPETKFIVDIVDVDSTNNEKLLENKHYCVATNTTSQPILNDNNYFDHHISLIEPSVIAQKRLVDNISTTYKLKNVTLEKHPAYPATQMGLNLVSATIPTNQRYGSFVYSSNSLGYYIFENIVGKRFDLVGSIKVKNRQGTEYTKIWNNIDQFATDDPNNPYMATFVIPKMRIVVGVGNSAALLGYASIHCRIEEYEPNGDTVLRFWEKDIISNSNLSALGGTYDGFHFTYQNSWLIESVVGYNSQTSKAYYRKYTNPNAEDPNYDFEIPIRTDKRYVIKVSLYQFPDNLNSGVDYVLKYTGQNPSNTIRFFTAGYQFDQFSAYVFANGDGLEPSTSSLSSQNTSGTTKMETYQAESGTLVFASSTPYSALALLQKAIINSSIYEKQDGVYIADINNSNLPFYISNNYVDDKDGVDSVIDDLRATAIIENFYNQKNLWEIMLEVGHYIHSIPELRFGKDDKFEITFNRLGRTKESEDNANKVSIYNSRSVESYVSATSSYITNMVQLGGMVEEWVSPKTTNETLLVSNDTAEIITTKPIIELLKIKARNNLNGQEADLTPFIYEENVYKTLDIQYNVEPNRGIAMFYRLGTNIITGGQFQLPQANTNIYTDYTFKKVLWCAFNVGGYKQVVSNDVSPNWDTIKVNDYSFFVRYRTKDSVRQNHIRPDLRKYLLNSKHDKFPEHNQFNNQTDVVVDSIKFGNNMYGKLIKTGNSSYEKMEWVDKYSNLKRKGELYRINGELYYVAKVTNYVFSSHILSDVKFSKDYNELSQVVGIPSEPRFYEISEQSLIWREFAINDILLLTDNKEQLQYKSNFVFNYEHLANLVVGEGTDFAKYAISVYKGDKDVDTYDQTIGQSSFYKEVINPINAYSSENTLTYEWDMEDNYSAGDKTIETPKTDYKSLLAVSYTDTYGKAPLFDFYILGSIPNISTDQNKVRELPESPIKTTLEDPDDTRTFVGNLDILGTNVMQYDNNLNGRGIGLLKDCREAMSINFNLQLATNSDTFVVSPYVFLPNKRNVRIVLLNEEINKLSSGYINNNTIITPIDNNGNEMGKFFEFEITKDTTTNTWDNSKTVWENFGIDLSSVFENVSSNHFVDTQGFQRVKSIAVLCDVPLNPSDESGENVSIIPEKTQFVFARNIPEFWDREKALSPIYFGSPNKATLFTNKQ